MQKLIKEYYRFWVAISFFSRLPTPKHINYKDSQNGEATKYLPIVGLILSGITALTFILIDSYLPKSLLILIIFIISALLSGLIHEDGFSDFLDGFGGGWDKDKILAIMKDSTIGVFGVAGLILLFALKFALLFHIDNKYIPIILIVSAILSRANALSLMYDMNYARSEKSKSSCMVSRISVFELVFILLCGILPLFYLQNYWAFLIIPILILFRFWAKSYMNKWIEGYTGDCLGFVQQSSEIIIYVLLLIVNKI